MTPRKRKHLDSLNTKTLKVVITLYCHAHHRERETLPSGLCPDCQQIHQYALEKLRKCPYGAEKPNCPKCPIHCYSKEMREKMNMIMRYSGPRMVVSHPVLSLYHLLNSRKKVSSFRSANSE